MKKIFFLIIVFYTVITPLTAYAVKPPDIGELLPPPGAGGKTEYVQALPKPTDVGIYTRIIQIMLGVATGLILVTFTVAGVMMVTARENEEQINKAKGIIIYALIGTALIAAAYAISLGVTKLEFFKP